MFINIRILNHLLDIGQLFLPKSILPSIEFAVMFVIAFDLCTLMKVLKLGSGLPSELYFFKLLLYRLSATILV